MDKVFEYKLEVAKLVGRQEGFMLGLINRLEVLGEKDNVTNSLVISELKDELKNINKQFDNLIILGRDIP